MMEDKGKILRNGLLGWYPFEKGKSVLSAGPDGRIVPYDGEKHDYIIVDEGWETLEEPVSFFTGLKKSLTDTGRLLISANNRLGIRYFCGDRDRYTGTVADCLEAYHDISPDTAEGRMYSKAEIGHILNRAGFDRLHFFSVMTDLCNPSLIISEDHIPNEDLTNRLIPTYNHPDTVFADERYMYMDLMDNGMFHKMANAFLIECTSGGSFSGIKYVTSSLERGENDAFYTVIDGSGHVEKSPVYPAGIKRLRETADNAKRLAERGINVLQGVLEDDRYRTEYVNEEISQRYLSRILREDTELFLKETDHFRDIILRSSDIVSPDKGDGEGAILRYGYIDMVPLNSFHAGDDFIFFDQEFCVEDYPANELIWRMIATFYAADPKAEKIYPKEKLLDRYDILRNYKKWQDMEWDFLRKLRKEKELQNYHDRVRAKRAVVRRNKSEMNLSAAERESRFFNIFDRIEGKRLYLFGSGKYADRFLNMYGNDFPVYGFLDNAEEKTGTKKRGIEIYKPELLNSLKDGTYKVLICMKDHVSASRQLEWMGIRDYSIFDPDRFYMTRPRTSIRIVKDLPRGEGSDLNEAAKENNADYHCHIGYCAGAFDMFHIGHLNLLRRAKERCDYLIVGVMSDERMYNLKKKYPVIPCNERMQVVAGCRYVDQVEELPADRAGIMDAWNMFHYDCMFSGDDHAEDPGWLAERERLRQHGSDIVFVSYTKEQSSSAIRGKMKE